MGEGIWRSSASDGSTFFPLHDSAPTDELEATGDKLDPRTRAQVRTHASDTGARVADRDCGLATSARFGSSACAKTAQTPTRKPKRQLPNTICSAWLAFSWAG